MPHQLPVPAAPPRRRVNNELVSEEDAAGMRNKFSVLSAPSSGSELCLSPTSSPTPNAPLLGGSPSPWWPDPPCLPLGRGQNREKEERGPVWQDGYALLREKLQKVFFEGIKVTEEFEELCQLLILNQLLYQAVGNQIGNSFYQIPGVHFTKSNSRRQAWMGAVYYSGHCSLLRSNFQMNCNRRNP